MTPEYPLLHIARLVLETTTPLSIASGSREAAFDTLLVRDANGLPTIPGSSLAGVLRHLYGQPVGLPSACSVFGYAEGDDGLPSRVQVSWGCIHDSNDRPVQGLYMGAAEDDLKADPLLHEVLDNHPLTRDHIRIGHRGAGDDKGKFDRSALHAGHRFSVEISFWSKGPDSDDATVDRQIWDRLLGLFAHPGFRLGGHTRRGLGAVKVVRLHSGRFALDDAQDFQRYGELGIDLGDTTGLDAYAIPSTHADSGWITASLELRPEQGWRFGQGDAPLSRADKDADLLPVTERQVYWDGHHGEMGPPRVLIPASGIKGALAHRVAFHHDCLAGDWANKERTKELKDERPHNPAVRDLFGFAKGADSNPASASGDPTAPDEGSPPQSPESTPQDRGRAGYVYLDDIYLGAQRRVHRQWHNGIDRFTGGVREHVLYGEELIWQDTLRLTLRIDPRAAALDADSRKAFDLALQDLCNGSLAIGGGSGKGHGYCQGTLTWSDQGRWLGETR